MASFILILITTLSYLQAIDDSQKIQLQRIRLILAILILLVCTMHILLAKDKEHVSQFLQQRVIWLFVVILLLVTCITTQKFYLLIPAVTGISLAAEPLHKITKQLTLVYCISFLMVVLVSTIKYHNFRTFGFYHQNVAYGYLLGIQILLSLMSVFYKKYRILYIFIIIASTLFFGIFTQSLGGALISILLVTILLIRKKTSFISKKIYVIPATILPALLSYFAVIIYRLNLFHIGESINSLLSSRPYIWSTVFEQHKLNLFPSNDVSIFMDTKGQSYSMPVDSVYISIPFSLGIIFSVLMFSLFIVFSNVSTKVHLLNSDIKELFLNKIILIHILMLLYGAIEVHAIEYQVNPVMILMFIILYRIYGVHKKNFMD